MFRFLVSHSDLLGTPPCPEAFQVGELQSLARPLYAVEFANLASLLVWTARYPPRVVLSRVDDRMRELTGCEWELLIHTGWLE